MEYLRGKSVEMVKKEIYSPLILYNIIRKMIREETPTENGNFPPYGSQVQTCTTMAKGAYVDKLGRSYHRLNIYLFQERHRFCLRIITCSEVIEINS